MSELKPSSLEEGLARGYGYAETHRDDRANLRRIVRARSAPDVTAHVDPAEVAPDGIANPVEFWSGFAHGVRRYLIDEAVGPSRRS
jgi:hypothetical protein